MNQVGRTPPPTAFIVDDEPMLLDLNESVLRSMGFEVRRFRAAEAAFEAFKSASPPPAIIVTDFAMHKMTGLDLVAACRQLHPEQKILLVSGTVDDSIFRDSAEKPNSFMFKPYTTEDFARKVRILTGL